MRDIAPAIVARYEAALEQGRGLYIHGGTGVGKTYLLVALVRDLAAKGKDVAPWTAADLLDEIRRDYDRGYPEMYDYFVTMPVLLVDDLGAGRTTAWGSERFMRLLDIRHTMDRMTYFTSNHTLGMLAGVFNRAYNQEAGVLVETRDGDRLRSRIAEHCVGLLLPGGDRRLGSGIKETRKEGEMA